MAQASAVHICVLAFKISLFREPPSWKPKRLYSYCEKHFLKQMYISNCSETDQNNLLSTNNLRATVKLEIDEHDITVYP